MRTRRLRPLTEKLVVGEGAAPSRHADLAFTGVYKTPLHGCTIESRCLIGMGAVILNGVTIGSGSIVAAGTLLTERTAIPPGSLVMGSPGKVKRGLTEADKASIDAYARRYVSYKNIYREEPTA